MTNKVEYIEHWAI